MENPGRGREAGQVIVEYVLMLTVAISLVSAIALTFRRSVVGLWRTMIYDISPGCPGCRPGP